MNLKSDVRAMPEALATPRGYRGILQGVRGRRAVRWVTGTATVATAVVWTALLTIWVPVGNQLIWAGGPADAEVFFRDASVRVILTTVTLLAVFSLITAGAGLVLSHRIGGPLHRMGLTARHVADGHYDERVSLRRGDYLHEFAREFNNMLERVEDRIRAQQRSIAEAHQRLSDLEIGLSRDRVDAVLVEETLHAALRDLQEARLNELTEVAPSRDEDRSKA